ncbi:MAG: OmpA family protein [Bacteroidetes bacterium]|nr:MAG: OmpA family protein [Bacteroidota bacterium]
MKKLLACLAAVACLLPASPESRAQNGDLSPHGMAAKLLFLDYGTPNSIDTLNISNGLEVSYWRYFNPFLTFAVPLKIGLANINGSEDRTRVVSVDGIAQLNFMRHHPRLKPYGMAGLGVVAEAGGSANVQIPVGLGLNYRVGENSFLSMQIEYRESFETARDNLQYGIGWHYRFSLPKPPPPPEPIDPDGDGIPTEKDDCPTEAGPALTNGCPDDDGDGIANAQDKCPEVAGLLSLGGCPDEKEPDADGDGVADAQDQCPGLPGPAHLFGCPDSDEDGIADKDDDCPEAAGKPATQGCPDNDDDGIPDKDDDCPQEAGIAENRGCPSFDLDNDGISNDKDDCPETPGSPATNGCPDSDGDGVPDKDDDCPETPGALAALGCPDRDGDGIADKNDQCPDEPGLLESKGCPDRDSDGDGLKDSEDQCPDQAGNPDLQGCPDSDGDGIPDQDDACPEKKGTFQGCPDTDEDGVPDHQDECPELAGPTDNKGCPDIEEADREILEGAAQAVMFETGKATLKASSFQVLEKVADLMTRYPDYNLLIEGHTDDVGELEANRILSEERAKACYEYLLARGVSPLRMQYRGYGELRPIADNSTPEGREKNRRVEFKLYLKKK